MEPNNESKKLDVTTIPDEEVAIPITLDEQAYAKIRKQKRKMAIAEAREFQYVGAKIIKVKNKVLAKIGDEIEKFGIKKIGHGRLASAAQNADEALAACDKYIADIVARDPNVDPEKIIAIMQLKRDFNKQIIELADAHIKADRQVSEAPKGNSLQLPFPAGTSMTISTAPAQVELKNAKA